MEWKRELGCECGGIESREIRVIPAVRAERDAGNGRGGDQIVLLCTTRMGWGARDLRPALARGARANLGIASRTFLERPRAELGRERAVARRRQGVPPEVVAVQEGWRDEDRARQLSLRELGHAYGDRALVGIIERQHDSGSLPGVAGERRRERDDVVRAHERVELRRKLPLRQMQRAITRSLCTIRNDVVISENEHVTATLSPHRTRNAAPECSVLDGALEVPAKIHDVRERCERQRFGAAPRSDDSIELCTQPRSVSGGV